MINPKPEEWGFVNDKLSMTEGEGHMFALFIIAAMVHMICTYVLRMIYNITNTITIIVIQK